MSESKPKIANEMNLTAAELRSEHAEAMRMLSETADERDSARVDLLDAAETERQLRARIAHLEAQVVELEQKDTRAVRAYYRVAEQRDALRAENAKLQQAVETWAKGHDAANARADRLADENEHLLECHAPDEYLRLREERDRLAAALESQGRDHDPATCTLGSLCPWCEIARLEAAVEGFQTAIGDYLVECSKPETDYGARSAARRRLFNALGRRLAGFSVPAKCETCERVTEVLRRVWYVAGEWLEMHAAPELVADIRALLAGTDGGDE